MESTHGEDAKAEQIPAGGEAVVYKKGAWSKDEDEKLRRAVDEHGLRNWVAIEKYSGLARPAKNCRLRWLNYLRPNLKKYPFTEEEEQKILHLHAKYGNSWSRIAAKLPGRSDNDIKNFWHKRAKKCQKHHLPIYPPSIHQQQDTPTDSSDNHCKNTDNVYFDNNPDQTLPCDSSATTSIYSTQTPISTPKPLFHSSSPTNTFTTTNLLADTPTSQPPQNLLLSPHQTSQSPVVVTNNTPQIQDSWQLRNPPILSSPQGRFRRFSGSKAQSIPSFLNTDSSTMESPKSPLKLKLSPAVYSVTATPDSPVLNLNKKNAHTSGASSSEFQLKSPPTTPLSPLHLRLSIPGPSDSSFKSNLPTPDVTVELNSSTSAVTLPSPRLHPELPPIPPKKVDTDHESSSNAKTEPPSIQFHAHAVQSCSDSEILDELTKAQERVRFLKKKLRQRKISNKRSLPKESSRNECFSSETSDLTGTGSRTEVQMDGNSSVITKTEQSPNTSMIGVSKTGQFKRVKSENELYLENSETRTLSGNSLQRRNSMTFQEQMQSLDLSDHNSQYNVNDPNSDSWCSSLESLFSESSTLVPDSFLIEDLFDQKSGIEGHEPPVDALSPIYIQGTATTLIKSGDKVHQSIYPQSDEGGFFSNGFEQEFSHGPENKFAENALMDQYLTSDLLDSSYVVSQPSNGGEEFTFRTSGEGNLVETSKLCDPNLLLQQQPGVNEVQPYSFQTPSDGFFGGGFTTGKTSSLTWKQEPTQDQSLMDSLLVENMWPEEQMITQEQRLPTNRNESAVNPSAMTPPVESNQNGESSHGHTGEELKQEPGHDYKITMPDDLSSLLEFFPTSLQTFEWSNNGDVFLDTKDFDEFDVHPGLNIPITITDYM